MVPADLPTAVQRELQACYRIEVPQAVDTFVSHDRAVYTELGGNDAIPDELLLLREIDGELDIGLFLDADMLQRASTALARECWSSRDFDDIASVIEGVSHLVCVLWHAEQSREVRPLDLELQAEIDKYLLLRRVCRDDAMRTRCRETLFDVTADDDDPALLERYSRARRDASIYCHWLQYRFGKDGDALQRELATFYRRSGPAKRRHISEVH